MNAFKLYSDDGHVQQCFTWLPSESAKGVVVLAHGMGEHAGRYHDVAVWLAEQGWAVYAHNHRGHGEEPEVRGWFAAENGWKHVVADLDRLVEKAREDYLSLPVVLFGHSMGSFISRSYFLEHGAKLSGLVLSATGYRQAPLSRVLRMVARIVGRKGQMDQPSRFMSWLIFGSFNLGFLPVKTPVDWLSRDREQIDRYLNDPLCGFDMTPGLWKDLFDGIIDMEQREKLGERLARGCPVLLMAGSRDPVSLGSLALRQLAKRYRKAGLADVSIHVYPGGRHEMLNEINREQVLQDIQAWLSKVA